MGSQSRFWDDVHNRHQPHQEHCRSSTTFRRRDRGLGIMEGSSRQYSMIVFWDPYKVSREISSLQKILRRKQCCAVVDTSTLVQYFWWRALCPWTSRQPHGRAKLRLSVSVKLNDTIKVIGISRLSLSLSAGAFLPPVWERRIELWHHITSHREQE